MSDFTIFFIGNPYELITMKIIDYFLSSSQRYAIPRNTLQFLAGATFFAAFYSELNIFKIIPAVVGAVIAYHSVYGLNDISDLEEDKKNPLKRAAKKLARGEMTVEEQTSRMFLFAVVGLSICFLVSGFFGALVALSMLLNFFHSYKPFGLKKTPVSIINIFLIESIKFSSAWFVVGGGFNNLPYFTVFCISAMYSLAYFIYKKNTDLNSMKTRRAIIFFAFIVVSFILSFYFYKPLRLTLLAVSLTFFLPLIIKKSEDVSSRLNAGAKFTLAILLLLNLLNVIVMFEPFSSINLFLASLF